jgi:diaminohydroxyphosphoribosylaminopyrimidine deaminase/5-amino-6-(5-phosphoribosylamino)uracil reductase
VPSSRRQIVKFVTGQVSVEVSPTKPEPRQATGFIVFWNCTTAIGWIRMTTSQDHRWMARCLELAEKGGGFVSPNPMVGCVIVGADGTILGKGWHRQFGGPHAEVNAVVAAQDAGHGDQLSTATLYVNLEPCSHHGKTPPCVDLVLEKKIPRVVVGMLDPSPEVAGKGVAALQAAGVDIRVGLMSHESFRLNEAFVHHVATSRPLLTLKVAQSLDGAVATATGDSQWISGPESRHLVHRWRSVIDAIMVGSGTALSDDPALTVRHVEGRQPWRIVLDRKGSLPADLRLFADEYTERTISVTAANSSPPYADALEKAGGRIINVPETNDHLDLRKLLERLGAGVVDVPPIQSVMVEGGSGLSTALMRAGLVDRLHLFIAPSLVGGGVPSFGDFGTSVASAAYTFAEHQWEHVGDDMLFRGYRYSVSDLEHLTRA